MFKMVTIRKHSIVILVLLAAPVLIGCIGPKTPLSKAVDRDDIQDVQVLLAQGADPCEEAGTYTAFDWAQGDNRELLKSDAIRTEIYRMLLDKAYQRYTAGLQCENIIFYAARLGDGEMIRRLVANGVDPDIKPEYWETSPLGIAAYYGNKDAVHALVEGGADLDPQIDNLDKARSWAMMIGRLSSYDRADQALKLLRTYKEKQGSEDRSAR